jgi:hypothetical protein
MRRDQRRRRCRSRRAQALPRLAFRRTHARGRARRRARPAARPPRDLTDHRNAVDVDRPEHCVLSGLRCAQSGADPVAVQDAAHTIRRRGQKSHRHRSSSRHPHAVVVARPLVVLALPLERFCAGAARRGRAARACRAPARRRADQQGGESCPRGRSGRSLRGPACRRRTCAPDWRSAGGGRISSSCPRVRSLMEGQDQAALRRSARCRSTARDRRTRCLLMPYPTAAPTWAHADAAVNARFSGR